AAGGGDVGPHHLAESDARGAFTRPVTAAWPLRRHCQLIGADAITRPTVIQENSPGFWTWENGNPTRGPRS
ncbi:MAG TPA: hypothetical protein VHK27_08445, partial [Gammaproteobacteria bacterium]|nr:hypothetical protein [Gammaproteobacteria bacterium]